ncbi:MULTISPECIES: MATE family efflux transporter [unclassified Ruminococcus]|uniref:MATE family efflux transporter n=1 Tax=unclassified Ruminococcus TaxID=2608920 RepID=UPI00210DEB56|nr:MATE family efflux transporter [Ruminococcus sp. zg-924]MCQ4114385.1 MATE family efflux transporter [Ruminococcus sp. zg-921]
MITDLTKGSPAKILWSFSMPMLLSSVFQQLYNMADSIVAGNFAGENALAAVGASFPVTMIFVAIAMGGSVGCNVVISRYFGGKDYRNMRLAINTSFISFVVLSLILTVFGLIFCDSVIALLNTPENIFADSSVYLKVYITGLIFLFVYNICNAIFTALGDSKTPLYFLIASSLGNIALDVLFVASFGLGVLGVAWATFVAQGVASVLAFFVLLRRLSKLKADNKEKAPIFSFSMLSHISRIAIPSIIQQSFVSVGNIFIQSLINGFGSATVAGYSAAVKINTFCITCFTSMSNGLSSYTSQNIGGKKLKRVILGYKSALVMALSFCAVVTVVSLTFRDSLVGLFMNSPSDVAIQTGSSFIIITSPFYFSVAAKLTTDAVLKGGGAMASFMTTTFSDLIIRVIMAFILSPFFGIYGIWWSWPVGWIISATISIVFYLRGNWRPKYARNLKLRHLTDS